MLRVDKEADVRGMCEGVEHHLWSSDSCPAYKGIRTLHYSKPVPQCTAFTVEGGGLLTEEFDVKAFWASFFERLYQADPPAVEWISGVLQSLLLTLQSTVIHLCLWKHRLR